MCAAALPKILFFGTPELAVYPLQHLLQSASYEMVGVVTQTDKPSGRGNKLTAPPVKQFAEAHGIKVFQPKTLKKISRSGETFTGESDDGLAEFLSGVKLDAMLVVAYGKIIPPVLLEAAANGIINMHYSLLPRFRGAAPIQRAILAGDTETGVSIMKIDAGLDSGPVFAVEKVPLTISDNSGTLTEKLNQSGTSLLLRVLPEILAGRLQPKPQPEVGVTYAEKLQKDDFDIRWSCSAEEIQRLIRAAAPHPGARSQLAGESIKIYAAHPVTNQNYPTAAAGSIVELNKAELIVATGKGGYISIDELQLAGRKRLPVAQVIQGRGIEAGMIFS